MYIDVDGSIFSGPSRPDLLTITLKMNFQNTILTSSMLLNLYFKMAKLDTVK